MEHLFKMGESNANINRSIAVGRDTFISAASLYQELYGLEDGTVPATFEVKPKTNTMHNYFLY